MKTLIPHSINGNSLVAYDANLNSMREELNAAISSLTELSSAEANAIKEFEEEVLEWDGRWDKCRLYLEQDDLSVASMENISELQIIALRNIESARESLAAAKIRKDSYDAQTTEATVSLNKLNSMEARQALLSATAAGGQRSYQSSEEYRAIRTTIATVQGFISLRDRT